MIRFVSISAFRTALGALQKVKRGVYAGVASEICKAFQGVSIEQIRANRDMILMDDASVTIKLRLPDKRQKLSKADGYRLIVCFCMISGMNSTIDRLLSTILTTIWQK